MRFPVHTEETLKTLDDALTRFHDNKDIFVILGIRDNFNIPKLPFARHYVRLIKLFGTTDNFDTEYTERLHIDLAKDAYDATNHKDEYPQMTLWLERKEKIHRHQKYILWCENGRLAPPRIEWLPPGLDLVRVLSMAKHPTAGRVFISDIIDEYGARNFLAALSRYVVLTNYPDISSQQLEDKIQNLHLAFGSLPVWHRIKFLRTDPFTKVTSTADSIHIQPSKFDSRERMVPGRFDTVLVNLNDGQSEATGVKGAP